MLDENVDINDFWSSALVFIYPSIAIEREIHDKVLRSAEISEPCAEHESIKHSFPYIAVDELEPAILTSKKWL